MKIIINACHGGFGLSDDAVQLYAKAKEMPLTRVNHPEWDLYHYTHADGSRFHDRDIERNDPDLVAVVENLGEAKSSGFCARLKVVDIPDDVEWQIEEYDGLEWVAEKHRTWN